MNDKNYTLRTDLALETIGILKENEHYKSKTNNYGNIKVTEIEVLESGTKLINKKMGFYTTIEFDDISEEEEKIKLKEIFASSLKSLLDKEKIKEEDSVLIIGLGNEKSTPDSLGPLSIDNVLVTNHLFMYGNVEGYRRVSAINPGVMGVTGIETSDLIKSIIKTSDPDFVIVVDALASSSIDRVNKTIQMTNTGIHPGSGVANSRKEISKEFLNKPVIAIGVPTVVDAVSIVSDTINYMCKHFTYMKKNIDNPINKLIPITQIDYSKTKTNPKDRLELLGKLGNLNDEEIRQLIFEVLTPVGYNLMVTPKDIDFQLEQLSNIIGDGLNKALHKNIVAK